MDEDKVKIRIATTMQILNEKQSRLYLAAESQSLGWGGKSKRSRLSGVSRQLISRGEKELENTEIQSSKERIRKAGTGRKKETDKQAGLISAIKQRRSPYRWRSHATVIVDKQEC
jgi:hypothetical protein